MQTHIPMCPHPCPPTQQTDADCACTDIQTDGWTHHKHRHAHTSQPHPTHPPPPHHSHPTTPPHTLGSLLYSPIYRECSLRPSSVDTGFLSHCPCSLHRTAGHSVGKHNWYTCIYPLRYALHDNTYGVN